MKEFCIECITCKNANYVTSKSFCGCGSETGCKYEKKTDITPWHTGTPTEEGWYVFKMKGADLYETEYFTGVNWNEEIIEKWQKIEETE